MIKNFCKDFKPDLNPLIHMCILYEGYKKCKLGHKAGLWCHIKPEVKK